MESYIRQATGHGTGSRAASLTNREREILTLIVAGKIDRDIAESLYIAPATVRVHVHAMLHKLGARDRSHAILIAQQLQLCDPSI